NERSRVSEMTGHDLPKRPVTMLRNPQKSRNTETEMQRKGRLRGLFFILPMKKAARSGHFSWAG
ncbi:hypothetical protein LZL89_18490, partial [Pseudomonas aeruginosa]|nr:hypothetical protein [Pseudomonas aeruginosa]